MFGIYVQERRLELGMDVPELARQTRIPVQRLRMIEEGKINTRVGTRDILQARLGLSETHLEKMVEIARVGFIDQFMNFAWLEVLESDESPNP